jgi:hypothetical protein
MKRSQGTMNSASTQPEPRKQGRIRHRVARVQRKDIEARADDPRHKPGRFAKTSVPVSNLSQLGRFLAEVADATSAEAMNTEQVQLSDAKHARSSEVVA